jgi:AcrR family transcriptional regulator/DNA-binding MarR family transcriptional regulator
MASHEPGLLRTRRDLPDAHGGRLYVSELQRVRLLDATFAVVYEQGYRGMAVRAVAERAGVSSKTFYDLFADREDCFLAAFNHGVEKLAAHARPAFEGERYWVARIRSCLAALLGFLDVELALRRLVFVEALAAGPRVLERRAQLLGELSGVVEDQAGMQAGSKLPGLIAEGAVGAALGVIHARLSEPHPEPLLGLSNELMTMIVLPYRGRAAAIRELSRPASKPALSGASRDTGSGSREVPVRFLGSGPVVDFRLTVRTHRVLAVVAAHPGSNNHRVSELAGISDQGQISRLMMRLSEQGLVENIGGQGQGAPKAWRLTEGGETIIQTHGPLANKPRQADPVLRLTALTYKVLAAAGELAGEGSSSSNLDLAKATGVRTTGQISKLLRRLEDHGLINNTGGATAGTPNAWRLTPRGRELTSLSSDRGALPSALEEETCP